MNNTRGSPTGFNLRGIEGIKFLVQLNWDITTGACALGMPHRPAPISLAPPGPLVGPGVVDLTSM